jgi:hypothetical protein
VGVAYTSGGDLRHGSYVNVYSLSSVRYCWLITYSFIAGLLWATGLWIVRLMVDGPLRHPVDLIKVVTLKRMRNWNELKSR